MLGWIGFSSRKWRLWVVDSLFCVPLLFYFSGPSHLRMEGMVFLCSCLRRVRDLSMVVVVKALMMEPASVAEAPRVTEF